MKILFVCLGNICRSPLAEAIFNHQVKELGLEGKFEVDSCGINSYHTGELADPRTRATAESFGITITHRARTFKIKDFDNYDHIFVMDKSNFDALLQFRPNDKVIQKIRFLRHFDPLSEGSEIVPDPYYGKQADFINVHQIITRSIKELLIQLQSKI